MKDLMVDLTTYLQNSKNIPTTASKVIYPSQLMPYKFI